MNSKIQVTFNSPEEKVITQMENCLTEDAIATIMGDSHYGYKIPVGGVIAYEKYISPSAVGFWWSSQLGQGAAGAKE